MLYEEWVEGREGNINCININKVISIGELWFISQDGAFVSSLKKLNFFLKKSVLSI